MVTDRHLLSALRTGSNHGRCRRNIQCNWQRKWAFLCVWWCKNGARCYNQTWTDHHGKWPYDTWRSKTLHSHNEGKEPQFSDIFRFLGLVNLTMFWFFFFVPDLIIFWFVSLRTRVVFMKTYLASLWELTKSRIKQGNKWVERFFLWHTQLSFRLAKCTGEEKFLSLKLLAFPKILLCFQGSFLRSDSSSSS